MIVYDLYCEQGHVFEGWFDDSADYRRQKEQGLISCPVCDSKTIEIRLSAVGLRRAGINTDSAPEFEAGETVDAETLEVVAQMQKDIAENFEDVGKDFASSVLKMHYGVEEVRNVRGVSSPEEEKQLENEGIPFFKLPMPGKTDGKKN